MFKRLSCVAFTLALCACSSEPAKDTAATEPAPPPKPAAAELWTVTEGIAAPESAYVDPKTGDIYVSNIDGMPGERDGKGHLSKISADGKNVTAVWVDGFNAPKGIRTYEGTLFTADIDEIVAVDMATGKVKSKTKVKGAQFLNDVAIGGDGTVYVSDMMGNKIYALKDGKLSTAAEGEALLEYPNGLLVDGDTLIVGGWGKPKSATEFATDVPGHLFKIDLKTKQKTLITPDPTANIDGLESDGKGGYIVSDYVAGKILHIGPDGKASTLTTFMPGTADLSFTAEGARMIVPHMNENKIVAYDISGSLQ